MEQPDIVLILTKEDLQDALWVLTGHKFGRPKSKYTK